MLFMDYHTSVFKLAFNKCMPILIIFLIRKIGKINEHNRKKKQLCSLLRKLSFHHTSFRKQFNNWIVFGVVGKFCLHYFPGQYPLPFQFPSFTSFTSLFRIILSSIQSWSIHPYFRYVFILFSFYIC